MVSLNTGLARRRVFYPRPIVAMPDILVIDVPAGLRDVNLPMGRYQPILVETAAELRELEVYLEEEREDPSALDPFASRPSTFPGHHIIIAHYSPPIEGWPYVILCRWPPDLTTAAEELRMFVRNAYTIELFDDREQLEGASDRLLALLKRRGRARVEIIPPDWSAAPGTPPH